MWVCEASEMNNWTVFGLIPNGPEKKKKKKNNNNNNNFASFRSDR